jgi:O-succinylbenzoic acid--CoA ligase
MSATLALDAAARDAGEDVALIDEIGRATTWGTLRDASARLGAAVEREVTRAGLGPRDLVCFVAHPSARTFALVHALIASGRAFLPLHPRLTTGEIGGLLDAIGPAFRLVDDWVEAAVDEAGRGPVPSLEPIPDDERTLAILASSGTTGRPKGVVLSRRAFAASAAASHVNLPLRRGDRWIACMPLAHAGGLSIITRSLVARSGVVLLPRFDVAALAPAVATHASTHLSVVPTMLRALVERGHRDLLDRLEAVLVGGAACPDDLLAEARDARIPAIATYGLTEACSQVTTQPLSDRRRPPDGDSGVPLPGVDLSIRGEQGEALGHEREGLIAIRGPSLFSGYRGAAPHAPEGWLPTGDFGLLREDGRLVVLARRTDLIVTGGENAYPAEIEASLRHLPGVRDCAVIGVPDNRWGAVVGVVLEASASADVEVLLGPALAQLAPHKRPRRAIVAAEPLPRTSKGEVDRAAVRARYGASLASASLIASGIGVGRNDVPSTTT